MTFKLLYVLKYLDIADHEWLDISPGNARSL